jgi:hypothetical protein
LRVDCSFHFPIDALAKPRAYGNVPRSAKLDKSRPLPMSFAVAMMNEH